MSPLFSFFFFFNDTATTEISPLPLPAPLPIYLLRMFLDEARLSATLTHPHVTEVYDVGTDGETPFFAMEYVLGSNLRQLMRAQAKVAEPAAERAMRETAPLPLPHAIRIVAAPPPRLHYPP